MRGWGWRSRSARPPVLRSAAVFGAAGSVACPYPAIASPVTGVVSSCASVVVGAGTVSGQSVCSVVSSAPATLVRCRGYGVRPASQRWTVLTSTPTTSANSSRVSPERVIAARRCSLSNAPPFSKVADLQRVECRCPKSSQDVLGDVPRCPCAVPGEPAWCWRGHRDPPDDRLAPPGWSRAADPR